MKSEIAPVLFLMFNRPALARKVFERIREVRPTRLFVAVDGPRVGRENDKLLTKECRDLVLEIDWPCEVKTLFGEANLGCKTAVSSAITWFFDNVEEGIILEDDCFPSASFFIYATELLERYRDTNKVLSIGGSSLGYNKKSEESYGFSGIMNMWGWATWSNRAQAIDYSVFTWSKRNSRKILFIKLLKMTWAGAPFRFSIYQGWATAFEGILKKNIDTWDYQWIYHGIMNDKISVFPTRNMIENIGFGVDSTHTVIEDHPLANICHEEIRFPLVHPSSYKLNKFYMKKNIYQVWGENSLTFKVDFINIYASIKKHIKFSFK